MNEPTPETRKGGWHVYLAMVLLTASYFLLFCVMTYITIPVVQVLFFFVALQIGMLALLLVQGKHGA